MARSFGGKTENRRTLPKPCHFALSERIFMAIWTRNPATAGWPNVALLLLRNQTACLLRVSTFGASSGRRGESAGGFH